MRWRLALVLFLIAPAAAGAQQRMKPEAGIRADAIAELSDSRFWNRPGASLDTYLADWTDCDRVVRGYRPGELPRAAGVAAGGTGAALPDPFIANIHLPPNSSVGAAAGLGALEGFLGSLFGELAENDLRRDNRVACLVARGWRLYRPDAATAERLRAADANGRQLLFAERVGMNTPPNAGERSVYRNFAVPPEPLQ